MTIFNENSSKTRLKQRMTQHMKSVHQRIELLKKKDGWIALMKPDPLRRARRGRAGISTFDATLWTLIAIGVLISVLSLYNGVVDSQRTASLRSQLTRAVAIIERDHTYSGVYTAASLVNFLKNEGFTTKELRKNGNDYEFFSPYGNPITIAPDSNNNRRFVVTVKDLPPSGCEATAMTFANKNAGLDTLLIEGTSVITTITEDAVRVACDADGNDEETDVTLTF